MAWQTQTEAETLVKDRSQYLKAPALTTGDITNCVLETRHASVWVATTAYNYGDRVLPTVRCGFYFVCATPGTTDSTEPVWPTLYGATRWQWREPGHVEVRQDYPAQVAGATGITDGGVVWVTQYPDWSSPYDVDAATYRAWMLKAAIASEAFDTSADGQSLSAGELYEHCRAMANRYLPTVLA